MSPLFILCAILVNVLFIACFRRLYSRSLGISMLGAWVVGVYYFICIPYTLIALNNGYEIKWGATGPWTSVDLNHHSFFYPFMFISFSQAFMCVLLLMITLNPGNNISAKELIQKVSLRLINAFLLSSCIFSMAVWALGIYSAGGFVEYFILYWYLRTSALQEILGQSYVILSYASIANNILFSASAAVYIANRALLNNGLSINRTILVIVLFAFLDLIMSGNRINIAVLGILLISMAIQLKVRRYLKWAVIIMPIAILFFSLWPSLRGHLGDLERGIEIHELRTQTESTISMPIFDAVEGSAVMLLFHIIKDFGDRIDYLYGASYVRLLDFLVTSPQNKSENFSIYLARTFEDTDETSFTATVLGEGYANFGPFSVLVLPIGMMTSYALTLMFGRNALVSAIGFLFILKSMRYFFSVMVVILLFLFPMYYIYKFISRLKTPFYVSVKLK